MAHNQETRERILDAAQAAFLEKGTSGARMQAIADRAGVNKALLHYYFSTKERLSEAVFRRAARRLLPPVLQELLSDRPLAEKVHTVIGLYLSMLPETPALPAYVLSEMHFHPDRAPQMLERMGGGQHDLYSARIVEVVGSQIRDEVAAGRMRDISAAQLVINLFSLCVFPFAARPMVEIMITGSGEGFESMIEERRTSLPEFFLAGLRP